MVDGYLDLFTGEYHDWKDQDWTTKGDDWPSETDLVTISWVDAENGELQHARLEGPWEDVDDLTDVVETYFEEGTP